MIISNDWILKQINTMSNFLEIMVGGDGRKNPTEQEPLDETNDFTMEELFKKMIKERRINEAEDMLFEYVSPDKPHRAITALHFYEEVNKLTDHELEKSNFSREEISEGLTDICKQLGFNIF